MYLTKVKFNTVRPKLSQVYLSQLNPSQIYFSSL